MIRSYARSASVRALVIVCAASFATSSQALVTFRNSTTFNNFVSGIELNSFIGANTFYGAGYTGTRSTVANIEGGIASSNHEMTSKISQTFYGVGALTTSAAVQEHATACTSMIGGYDSAAGYDGQVGETHTSYSTGIAYGASLWTGNIATSINASSGSFSTTTNSTFTAYYNALIGGVNGSTANIASSSWGATSSDATTQRSLSAGLSLDALTIDSIVAASHKVIVIAAGNNGTSAGILHTPGSPAAGNNALVVGSSGPNSYNTPSTAFNARSSFSAYGPSAAVIATTGQSGNLVNESTSQRARVDILAPGQAIVGASASGPGYYIGGDGTSFATPIVAGGVALIEDAGKALGYTNAVDNRVVTAILQTSATKLAGWTNNSAVVNGVQKTTQALDYQQGAGELNLTSAYDVLTGGTHDVAGTGGGAVKAKGWDYGELGLGGSNSYTMSLGTGLFTATMRFDSGATYGTLGANNTVTSSNLQFQYLSNFSLQLYSGATLVAESDAQYITSEHFVFDVKNAGNYTLKVNYLNDIYNLSGHGNIGYGVAWLGNAAPVPEPASMVALGLGVAAFVRRRRRA